MNDTHTYSPYLLIWIVVFLCLVFFGLGIREIGKQTLVDEPLWLFKRVENYTKGIYHQDLLITRVSNKPGITISLLSSPALAVFRAPSELRDVITPQQYEYLATLMRIPIVIAVTILLVLLYYTIRHMTDQITALLTLTFVALSPTLLGMTRMVNPDALLWILLPLTFWVMVIALTERSRRAVILAGILFGCGLLTKYISNLLFVMMPLIAAMSVLYRDQFTTRASVQAELRAGLRTMLIITGIAFLVYALLLPSVWVRPIDFLRGTFLSEAFAPVWEIYVGLMIFFAIDLTVSKRSIFAALFKALRRLRPFLTSVAAMTFFFLCAGVIVSALLGLGPDYQEALRSPKSAGASIGIIGTFLSGFYSIVFGVPLWILVPFLVTLLLVPTLRPRQQYPILLALAFIVLYYAGSAVSGVAPTLRYQIALFPLVFFVAAYGARHMCDVEPVRRYLTPIYIAASIMVLGAILLMQAPYYMSYHNQLLPPGHLFDFKNMGDGSYQAAQYLNALPYASNLRIWSDKSGVCSAFVGTCTGTVDPGRIAEENLRFDYFVISPGRAHQVIRESNSKLRRKKAPVEHVHHFADLYDPRTPKIHSIMRSSVPESALHIISARDAQIQRENQYKAK